MWRDNWEVGAYRVGSIRQYSPDRDEWDLTRNERIVEDLWGTMTQVEMARSMGVSKQRITQIVQSLVQKGVLI